jgi:hypothetical protein
MKFYNEATDMLAIIKDDKSYVLAGENPDSVTDAELWDMADGIAPKGWVNNDELIAAAIAEG